MDHISMGSDTSITFSKRNGQTNLTKIHAIPRYDIQELNESIKTINNFINDRIRTLTLDLTKKIIKQDATIKINHCLQIAFEAIHLRVNFLQNGNAKATFGNKQIRHSDYYSGLLQQKWPNIANEAPQFYREILRLITNDTSDLCNELLQLKTELEKFAEHQDTAPIYIHYREAIGMPMTNAMQCIQNQLEHNIYVAADKIEKDNELNGKIGTTTDLSLLLKIQSALQIKNKLPLLFSPSTRNIRLQKIEKRIKDLQNQQVA